ncbi:MAG: hypothetical protein EOO38_30265 [Cytophagaceae bacterium]|nr:MAG: hypothetical protein EOO38_30265 [Cytophagaceae bacterium]
MTEAIHGSPIGRSEVQATIKNVPELLQHRVTAPHAMINAKLEGHLQYFYGFYARQVWLYNSVYCIGGPNDAAERAE